MLGSVLNPPLRTLLCALVCVLLFFGPLFSAVASADSDQSTGDQDLHLTRPIISTTDTSTGPDNGSGDPGSEGDPDDPDTTPVATAEVMAGFYTVVGR